MKKFILVLILSNILLASVFAQTSDKTKVILVNPGVFYLILP